jgi:hypothetical protein
MRRQSRLGQHRAAPRGGLAGIAALAALLSNGPYAEAGASIQLPPECGSPTEFTRELERLLGDQVAEGRPISLVIFPRDGAGAYTLRLQLRNETRELRDPDCRALFRSAVVISAAAVRPELRDVPETTVVERPPPATAAPSSKGLPPDLKARPVLRAEPATQTDGETWRPGIHAGAGAMAGLLPGVAPMLELGGSAARGKWGLFGAARYLPRARTTDDEGRGVAIWALGGQVALFLEPAEWIRLSAGLAVHWLEGEGVGVAQKLTDSAWSLSSLIEATFIAWQARDLRVELGLQGHGSIVRARFEIGGLGEVYRVPPFSGAAVARVALSL